jgi:Zn-dependent alcohol dehydrogenase
VNKGLKCGAFAEKVVVHASQIAFVGEDVPPESACLLACGVPTGLGAAVNTAGVRPGDTVAVIGLGGVGLNAVQGARLAGAARIIGMDLEPSKLEDAKVFGATDGVLVSDEKPWRAVKALTGGRGADHVFVSVGVIPAYDLAPRLLARGGTVYAVGMPHNSETTAVAPDMMAATGQGMRGSLMGDIVLARDVPWMVDLYGQGRLELDALISGRWTPRPDQRGHRRHQRGQGAAERHRLLKGGTAMRLTGLEIFAVAPPPPGWGGRHWQIVRADHR